MELLRASARENCAIPKAVSEQASLPSERRRLRIFRGGPLRTSRLRWGSTPGELCGRRPIRPYRWSSCLPRCQKSDAKATQSILLSLD